MTGQGWAKRGMGGGFAGDARPETQESGE